MQKFGIFIKSNKFYWTKNRTIYSIFFFCLFIIIVNQRFLKIETDLIIGIFGGSIAILAFIALFWSIFGMANPDSLKGTIEGFITFKNNVIEVGNETFELKNIKNIEIANEDYCGKKNLRNKGDFNSTLSNGVKNHLKITFLSKEQKTYNFQLLNSNDFQNVRIELIEYCKSGKITFENICKVLGEETKKEKDELKRELST
tara:strand:+ start:977 stop:1579 length:603 start_codon:yes stop_codon:yes gene_type:complete